MVGVDIRIVEVVTNSKNKTESVILAGRLLAKGFDAGLDPRLHFLVLQGQLVAGMRFR